MQSSKPLWKHQVDTINRAFRIGKAPNGDPEPTNELALFHEQGTGKTRTLIEIIRRQYANNGSLMRTLVVCPLIVKRQWKEQIAAYSKINKWDVIVLDGSEKRRCKEFYEAVQIDGVLKRPKIIIINPHTLLMEELMKSIKSWGPEVLIIDESHEFKAHNSARSKAILPIADAAKLRYIATGTPIANTESDIFMQYRILDGGKTFGTNFYVFRKMHYYDDNAAFASKDWHFPKLICSEESKKAIRDAMYKKAVRAEKKDCLDLPPYVRQILEVEMSPEQKKAYAEMREDFITWINNKHEEPRAIVAQMALTKSMKLQQIVSGFAFDDKGEAVRFKKVPRLEVLAEQLEALTKTTKVIVWANFIENYKMIAEVCDKLNIKYVEIVGGMSTKEREDSVKLFNSDPEYMVAIANQQAGGTGLDGLQPASYAIYYSKDHSMLKNEQSEARNYRGGSNIHESVTRIDLVCYDTIDEAINTALSMKQDLAKFILDQDLLEKI